MTEADGAAVGAAVLVTGATGFVGRDLIRQLVRAGEPVRAALRSPPSTPLPCETVVVGDVGPDTDWSRALAGVDRVVHLAARVHVMADRDPDPLAAFRRVNRDGTRRLAEAAAAAGVRRLLFVSSLKAMADEGSDRPLIEAVCPQPGTPYGRSKLEAELALGAVAERSGLEAVVLRPPLVYGPGVRGNFVQLLRLVASGLPLPFGSIDNRRSLVSVGNLGSAIQFTLAHPAAAGRTFLVHDGAPLATPDLVRRIAAALGRPCRLVTVPPRLPALAARLVGKAEAWQRLAGSLAVDDAALRQLGWQPAETLEEALQATAAWFRGRTAGQEARSRGG